MTDPTSPDAEGAVAVVTELKAMLGDVLDVVLEAKQASRSVPEHEQLHGRLDALFAGAQGWVGQLGARTGELGGSPHEGGTTVAGREPGTLFPGGDPDRAEVARVLVEHLEPVVAHARLHQSRMGEVDTASAQLLGEVADGLAAYQWSLSAVDDEPAPQ